MPGLQQLQERPRGRIGRALAALLLLLALSALAPAGGAEPPLAVALLPVGLPLDDGSGELALLVVIEIAPGAARAALAAGEVKLALRDAQGQERGALQQPFALASESGASRGIRLYSEFRLAPGSYALEATARDEASGATGRAVAEVRLTKGGAGAWIASPALVTDRRAGWLAARADQADVRRLPFAFLAPGGGAYLPAASIEVGAGERIAAQAFVATSSRDFPIVVAEASDARGGPPRPIAATMTRVSPSPYPGVLAVTLELGPLETAGNYRLRLGLATPDGRLETPIGATLAVHALAGPAAPLGGTGGALAPGSVAPDAGLANRYRRILATLSSAGVDAAAPEMVRFELASRESADGSRLSRTTDELHDSERAVVAALERKAGPDIQPTRFAIAALDLAAAVLYRERSESRMAAEALVRAVELLSDIARGADPGLRARAIDGLALASPTQALDFDPDHPLALLRTAIDQERARQLPAASRTLARLLRAQPDHAEARLRSAVVLRRMGENADAREELARLVAAPAAAPWILELAYSELAAIDRELGRPDDALHWLEQGVARTDAQSLHYQLAFSFDRANRTSAATAEVNRLPVGRTDAPSAARLLYSMAPVEETASARARVSAALAEALPALGRALGGDVVRGGGR